MRITENERFIARNKGNSVDVDWRQSERKAGRGKNKTYSKRRKFELDGQPITAKELASRAGLSATYMQKLLHTLTPQEALDYAKERRL